MAKKIACYWPGDQRQKPNELALESVEAATVQIERALTKLGKAPYRIPGFLSKPHEAIEKLGPIDDPIVGVFVHWVYGPHTTDGVVGKDNPAAPRQQLLRALAGPRRTAQHGRVPRRA